VDNSGKVFDPWHLISMREIINKKTTLTDLARENRGQKRPAISAKNLANKEERSVIILAFLLTFFPQASAKSATIPNHLV